MYSNEELMNKDMFIEVAKKKYAAKIELKTLKDSQIRYS